MFGLFKKGNSTKETENKFHSFEDNDPSTLSKLTVFGYSGNFSNLPVISIYFNNLLIGEVCKDEIKTFMVPAPGMVTFKYKRKSTAVAITGEAGIQLDWDRSWGNIIAMKV